MILGKSFYICSGVHKIHSELIEIHIILNTHILLKEELQ